MKNTIRTTLAIFIAILIFANLSLAQTGPWTVNGNNSSTAGSFNKLGTLSNFPLNIYSAGIQRMKLNGTLTTSINSVNQNVSGFLGLGPDNYFLNNPAVSMLHLYGSNSDTYGIGGGWRKWMKSGIFINENADAMYIGMKPRTGGTGRSDATIGWSDDVGSGGGNDDKLRFVFTA